MKRIVLIVVVLMLLIGALFVMIKQSEPMKVEGGKPWEISADSDLATKVLGVNIGQDVLATVIQEFQKIPELAVFHSKEDKYLVEAFFSQVRLGVLKANIVAELDIEGVDLSSYAKLETAGKPMPSGQRKYTVSLTGIKEANKLRVWKLAYVPVINYSEEQLLQFFSIPEKKITVVEGSELWLYPDRSLIVSYNLNGKEVFYYTAGKEYKRLLDELMQQKAKS